MADKRVATTIVTGHANADYDCFSAIVAAGKLYPDAVLIFPGSQERGLRNFYIESAIYLFNFVAAKDVDLTRVQTLVVVDTRQRHRLAHVAQVFDNPGLVIHTYDHHPDSPDDLPAQLSVWKPWGSCAAVITREIMDRKAEVGPEEATAIALGIYEDTGSFTFGSTTEHDLAAAAWLRGRGMDLEVISELITRELTAQQVGILNTLLESAVTHVIGGKEIVVAEASMDHYVGDFAVLAHKFMEMENCKVLLALGRMEDRIQLVARSRDAQVDVARVCERFGGGGHAYAASASIKDLTLAQIKDALFTQLYTQIRSELFVERFMSRPAMVVDEGRTMAEAKEIMTRYGLKALPVVSAEQVLVGVLELDIADKAMSHGLADVAVREYMQRDAGTVSPRDDLHAAMDIILGRRQRLVPVLEADGSGKVAGVLTRTDLIHLLVEEPARIPEALYPDKRGKKNVGGHIAARLPREVVELLKAAGQLGQERGAEIFAVGGFVRDLLLAQPNLDLDLVVEEDGIAFAQALAQRLGGRVKAHEKFRTAVVVLDNGQRIDVATARLEYYAYPAALPVVELSSIKMDLYRRDFTVNALAVHLNPERFGLLEDFFGGVQDLKNRTIRVLHSLSFVEDPTRILRAIRFEQRFGFKIDGQTDRLIRNALQLAFFERLSGSRVFHELRLILDEKSALACLLRMEEYGLLARIHPCLGLKGKRPSFLEELQGVRDWYRLSYEEPAVESWKLFLLGLADGAMPDAAAEMVANLGFAERQRRQFLAVREALGRSIGSLIRWHGQSGTGGRASELAGILSGLSVEAILLLMAKSTKDDVRKALANYLTRLRHLRPDIDGADLLGLGLAPGPEYTRILRAVLRAKQDGEADCREAQLALVRQLLHASVLGPLPDASSR